MPICCLWLHNVYEKNHEYQDAKDILLMAFERAPIGKRLLYKLTDLALKEGNVEEANAYYRSSVIWREMIRASICSAI